MPPLASTTLRSAISDLHLFFNMGISLSLSLSEPVACGHHTLFTSEYSFDSVTVQCKLVSINIIPINIIPVNHWLLFFQATVFLVPLGLSHTGPDSADTRARAGSAIGSRAHSGGALLALPPGGEPGFSRSGFLELPLH